jgi:hypothetical protein
MADKKEPKKELCHINVKVVENGYEIHCTYSPEETLSQKAGWVPPASYECKEYVAKTKADLKNRFNQILDEA